MSADREVGSLSEIVSGGALRRAGQLLALSLIAKVKGLEAPPPPEQRDRLDRKGSAPVPAHDSGDTKTTVGDRSD
jgi:hypothetical protein